MVGLYQGFVPLKLFLPSRPKVLISRYQMLIPNMHLPSNCRVYSQSNFFYNGSNLSDHDMHVSEDTHHLYKTFTQS